LDISWANSAPGKICGDFVCWAVSFVLDYAGGGLLHTPMETWSMSAGTADFVVGVDEKLWIGFGLFQNSKSFFGASGAVFGSESFDHTDWNALPDDAAGCSVALVSWGWVGVTELGCKMFSVGVRFLAKFDWFLDFIEVLLHSVFEFLLRVSYVHFSCVVAFDFVDCC